jgi:hypothetical protein
LDGWHNAAHRSVKCSVTISYADLTEVLAAQAMRPRQGSHHRSQRS